MTTSPPPFGVIRPSSPSISWAPSLPAVLPAPADNVSFPLPFWVCDAFTAEPFAGNPAAVVLLPAGGNFPDVLWMAKVRARFFCDALSIVVIIIIIPASAHAYRRVRRTLTRCPRTPRALARSCARVPRRAGDC
jgi:hypothetical protein